MPSVCTCAACARANTGRKVLCALYECCALFNRYEDGAGFYYCGEHAGFCSNCESEELVSDLNANGECDYCSRPFCSVCSYRFTPNVDDDTCHTCQDCLEPERSCLCFTPSEHGTKPAVLECAPEGVDFS